MKFTLIPIAALLILPNCAARADGLEPTAKGAHYYSEGPSTRFMRISACGRYITPRECNAIQAKNEYRPRAARRNSSPRVIREKVYVSERSRDRDDYDVRPTRGQCVSEVYTAEGSKNVFKNVAQYNAREAWRRKVRSKHGTQYQDVANALRSSTKCWPEGMFTRCEFQGRACKA